MSLSHEKLLLSVRFIDGLIKSCLSVSYYELVKRLSEKEYGDATKLKSILDNIHDSLFVIATLFVSWLISKSRAKTWIKLEHLIWVPLLNSTLQLTLQLYSENYAIDATSYIIASCSVALSSSTLWIDNIAVELINSESSNRMSMYLYMKGSGILSNAITVIFALSLSEHNMVYIVAPILILIKSICVLAFTILTGKIKRSTDATVHEPVANDEPKTTNHALWIISLLAWALFYTQRCEYYYTYLFLTSKLNIAVKWWRVSQNLQYVSFAIALYMSGRLVERKKLSAYKILLVTLTCSILARCVQVTAWYVSSFGAYIAVIVISSICPPAGEILKSNVLASLRDSPYAMVLMSVTLYACQTVFIWVYYYVDAAKVSPFVVTTALMVVVLALSCTRLVKDLTRKFNKS